MLMSLCYLLLLNAACLVEKQQKQVTMSNFIIFGLTRLGLEHMIYHTCGEHGNYYTTKTKAVGSSDNNMCWQPCFASNTGSHIWKGRNLMSESLNLMIDSDTCNKNNPTV